MPASADALTVAQAFHWFDGQAALTEIHRVLRLDRRPPWVWNRRQMDDPVNQAIQELLARTEARCPRCRPVLGRSPSSAPSSSGRSRSGCSRTTNHLTQTAWPTRIASVNFIAKLGEQERTKVIEAARSLAGSGRVTIRQDTEVQVAERVEQ